MGVIEADDRVWKGVQMTEEKQGAAEWLRGIVDGAHRNETYPSCEGIARTFFGLECPDARQHGSCILMMLTAIADRIDAERALPEGIEWPRFEDGELVRRGDEVEWDGDVMRVGAFWFHREGWSLNVFCPGLDGTFHGEYGERVKRPTPKVLDADGVPIEVGDTVYYDGEPHPLTVVGITRDGKDALVDANGEESCVEGGRPQDFSHDAPKPVLDADGAPINVGDVVYFVGGSGTRFAVKDIGFKQDWPFVYIIDEDRYSSTVNPEILTHERPDSWERIEEDAKLAPRDYLEKRGMNPEKTERVASMMADLVRRAKALAKAGEQG